MREHVVRAWGEREVALAPDVAAGLKATGLVRVEVGPAPGRYVLRAGSRVGVAAGPGWQLRVTSHLRVREVMFLLCYARDPAGWRRTFALLSSADELLSSVAWSFLAAAEDALRRGPLHGYREVREPLPVLRGRVLFAEQAARGGRLTPIDVEHDEHDADIPENQLVLAAARLLERLPLVAPDQRRRLRTIARTLADVSPLPRGAPVPVPALSRLNEHYRQVLVLADLILRGASVSFVSGDVSSVAFSFELHQVFEHFLGTALGESFRRRGIVLREQVRGHHLDRGRTIGLVPDLVAYRDGRCLSVLDAKFKREDTRVGSDAYQMLAYLLELGPPTGVLVSAHGPGQDHEIRAVDKRIAVRSVSLDRSPEEILRAVDALADEVSLADGARHKRGKTLTGKAVQ